jgi:DNA-binding MarR family transcriptional regulator
MTRLGSPPSPNSLQARIRATLKRHPRGLTSTQLAEHLSSTPYTVSSVVSKMAAYGIVEKVKKYDEKTVWKEKA